MTKTPVNDAALDQIWRHGRSYNGWTDARVRTLRALLTDG